MYTLYNYVTGYTLLLQYEYRVTKSYIRHQAYRLHTPFNMERHDHTHIYAKLRLFSVQETQTVYFKLRKKLLHKGTIKENVYNFLILQYRKTIQIVRFYHQERNGRKYHFHCIP